MPEGLTQTKTPTSKTPAGFTSECRPVSFRNGGRLQIGTVAGFTSENPAGINRNPQPGAINGGFFPKKPDWPAQYPSLVIAVDDIQAAMRQVTDAGGKVLGEPLEIPGVGQYVSFFDTEGNRVSMLQPIPRN